MEWFTSMDDKYKVLFGITMALAAIGLSLNIKSANCSVGNTTIDVRCIDDEQNSDDE